jgi:hypothetical protein
MKGFKGLLGAVVAVVCLLGGGLLWTSGVAVADSCPNVLFRTGPGAGLPDCRAYELVSPAGSAGEAYLPRVGVPNARDVQTAFPLRAAVDGDGVVYAEDAPATGGNGAIGHGYGNQYLATRGAGWAASDITPPGTTFSSQTEYTAFSSDLSLGILQSEDYSQPALTPDAPSRCWGLYSRRRSDGSLRALFTETQTPEYCGRPANGGRGDHFRFAGASGDGSQILFQTQAALIPGAKEATGGGNDLYDSVAGRLSLVSVLPGAGGEASDATFGSFAEESFAGAPEPSDFSNVFSVDGSRVYWTDLATGGVYLRENPAQPQSALDGEGKCTEPGRACTVQVSGSGVAQYWTATPDGRYAYYTESGELWRFDAQGDTREMLASPGAEVSGVIGVNETGEDGAYVYFVAGGALAPGASPNSCAPGGMCNLYLLHTGEPVKFIAILAAEDNIFELTTGVQTGDWRFNLGRRTAELTPDGHSLLFESHLSLAEAAGAHGGGIFVYDADTGRISCASCNPSGAASEVNFEYSLPPTQENTFMPRWISSDGSRVFFNSNEALVPRSSDAQDSSFGSEGYENVFEWEREGAGSCAASVPARVNGGCVYLLSGGASAGDSFFIDASASGDDVFFVSREEFLPQAAGDHMKLYDARVGGGFPAPAEAVGSSCVGDACREALASSSSSLAAPGSMTVSGVGNLAPPATPPALRKATKKKPVRCSRSRRPRHGKCVKAKAKRSSYNRRGK